MTSIGIDIGGTCIKAAAINDGRVLWTGRSPFYSKPSADALRQAIRDAVGGRLAEVHTVGLCVPGILDSAERIITLAVNVPGLVGLSLDTLVPESVGLKFAGCACILNDARAAAHDVYLASQTKGRLLVLTIGTGVGSAVLDDGKPLLVTEGSSGHLGQIDVSLPGAVPVGPDGGAGGLEAYMGVAAIREKYGTDISAAIAKFTGDETPILGLVRALRICHAIYRPDQICLCGGIGIRLRHLLLVLRRRISDRLTGLARPGWQLTCGIDDHHAARGAAFLAAGE
jgi:glucokinase